MARIDPLEAPYPPDAAVVLAAMVPEGVEPIALFRTFARNLLMAEAMRPWGSYELSRRLSLSLRDREIVIDRTCARCRCEYEWGVHVAYFSARAELSDDQIASLTHGSAEDACWTAPRDRLLIRAVDALHDDADIGDDLWDALADELDPAQLLDLTVLCGWYHAIAFTATAARVAREPWAPTFDSFPTQGEPMDTKTMPAITHVALTVTDLAASEAWYTQLLGAAPVLDEDTGPFRHIVYSVGGTLLGLHGFPDLASTERFDERRPGLDHVAFGCASRGELEEWAARLEALGIEHGGIVDAGYGSGLSFRDPDGIALELFAPPGS